ncbi:MAG: hypothetical protein WA936_04860 [Erythrobacter sp.]
MPLFFFHYRDGEDAVLDPDGRTFDKYDSMVAAALTEARSQISADALEGHIDLACEIWVENEAGEQVHRIPFCEAVRLYNC